MNIVQQEKCVYAQAKNSVVNLILLCTLIAIFSCSGQSEKNEDSLEKPVHYRVIAVNTHESQPAINIFTKWIKEEDVFYRPGSEYTIHELDHQTLQEEPPVLHLSIPQQWPRKNALKAREQFVKSTIGYLMNREGPSPLPLIDITHWGQTPKVKPLKTELFIIGNDPLLDSRTWEKASQNTVNKAPLHFLCLLDGSHSGVAKTKLKNHLSDAYQQFFEHSQLTPGSSFSLYVAGTTRESASLLMSNTIPDSEISDRLISCLIARNLLDSLEIPDRPNASAIIESLHRGLSEVQEKQGAYEVCIISDLRQITLGGTWYFESYIPTEIRFLKWVKANALMMDLSHIPVTCVGVHQERRSIKHAFTAKKSEQIRTLWRTTLTAMGATEVYFYSNTTK